MKKFFKILLIMIIISASSCAKDELMITTPTKQVGKITFSKIKDLPFLIPSLIEYNKKYDFLLSDGENRNQNDITLNLDLDNILVYNINNQVSYSIKTKDIFEDGQDKYFENLTIILKNGEYQSLIFEYNAIDDSKIFNLDTFTGDFKLYDLNKQLLNFIQYENGQQKCVKLILGCWEIWDFGGGDLYVGNNCGSDSGGGSNNQGNSGNSGGNNTSNGGTNTGPGPSGSTSGGGQGPNFGLPGTNGLLGYNVAPNPVSPLQYFSNSLGVYAQNFNNLSSDATNVIADYLIEINYHPTLPVKNALINLFSNQVVNNFIANSSAETQTSIFTFLTQNEFSSESVTTINEMTALASASNSSFVIDNTINQTNAINFNSLADFQNYLNDFSNNTSDSFSLTQQGDTKNARFKRTINGIMDINVEVNQTLNPFAINSVSSSLTGITLGLVLFKQHLIMLHK